MFLLVSGRHVGAHTNGHRHGISIQISINLGKKFLCISRIRKIAVTRILASVFAYLPSFISQILDFIYWPVLIFILIYFELRDTENQQLQRSIVHNLIHLKRWYSRDKLLQVFAVWRVVNISRLYSNACQQNMPPANEIMAPLAFRASEIIFAGIPLS